MVSALRAKMRREKTAATPADAMGACVGVAFAGLPESSAERGMSMKRVNAKLLVVAAVIVMAALLLTGCEKEKGNELTVAVGSQFTTLDPALNTEFANSYVMVHMYSGMFRRGAEGEVFNDLCESYEVSDDGLTYTFHMVPDAVWSDGKPITAYDFEYSYLRALSYGVENAWAINDIVNFVEGAQEYSAAAQAEGKSFDCTTADHSSVGITAVDDTTLVLKLKTPCTYLTALMANNAWVTVREDFAVQHDSLWAFSGGYPTSGAYTLVECNANQKAVLARNEKYRYADQVTMDTITFLCLADEDAQALAYQSGEIDVALGVSTETAISYTDSDDLWLMSQPSSYFLVINSGSTGPQWARDVRVRRALALAIDKESVVSILGGSLFFPVLHGYVPEGIPGVEESFRSEGDADGYTLVYDPDEAKALLAQAGYDASNPLHIVYKYSTNGVHGDVATMLQQMWKAVGIDVEFQSVESAAFYDQLDQGDFEIARYGYGAGDSAIQYLDLWTTGMQVVAAIDDPEFDRMVAEAHTIVDPVEFNRAMHAAEDYLVEENVYLIPLFNFDTPVLVHSNITGSTINGIYPYFGYTAIVK